MSKFHCNRSSIVSINNSKAQFITRVVIDGLDSEFGNKVAQDGATSEGGSQVAFSVPDNGFPDTEQELGNAIVDNDGVDEVENKELSVKVASNKHSCQ